MSKYIFHEDEWKQYEDGYTTAYITNYGGQAELSSRTPFARIWTGIDLQLFTRNKSGAPILDENKDPITETMVKEVFSIGNNVYNNATTKPNQSRSTTHQASTIDDSVRKAIIPKEFETNNNEFLQPPAGIQSITSQTEGMGAIKKTIDGNACCQILVEKN